MDLAQKIKLLRSENGWTQEDLAKKSGVSIQSIKRYETGIGENITTSNLEKIAKVFEVKKSYFLNDDESSLVVRKFDENLVRKSFVSPSNLKPQNKSNDNTEENGIIAVPYFEDTYASAGDGAINYEEAPTTLEFTENFLRGFLRISGDLSKVHIINAKGDSMEPTIVNGELLFISTANAGGVISGNIYVINYGGDVFVKRLEKNPITRAVTLFSDNEKYEPIVIDGENLENCTIVGRVVAHIRKGVI
jgi:hypothetical protein